MRTYRMTTALTALVSMAAYASASFAEETGVTVRAVTDFPQQETEAGFKFKDRWNLTGYAEIAVQRNFDRIGGHHASPLPGYPAWNLNLPKACIWAEFNAGSNWTIGTQIEFANSGTVSHEGRGSVSTRPMLWKQELELSEFWVQKGFSDAANVKVGLIGTPVGRQNDLPTQFFGVIRPEDGPAFLALNNQSPAIDFNGEAGVWAYDVMFIPGLVNYDYGNDSWRYGVSGENTYTQTVDRLFAGAFRVDNSSVPGLTVGVSGEAGGGSTWTDTATDGEEEALHTKIKSTVLLGSLDWEYNDNDIIFRGACHYGYVGNRKPRNASGISPRDLQAMSVGAEFGYDFFSLSKRLAGKQKFYLFARYDWCGRCNYAGDEGVWQEGQRCSVGINWMPLPTIIVKGEWGFGADHDPARTFGGLSIAWQPSWP